MQECEQTVVSFYRCYRCRRQLFEDNIRSGQGCSCGSMHVTDLRNPSAWNWLRLFIHSPKLLKVFFHENILGRPRAV